MIQPIMLGVSAAILYVMIAGVTWRFTSHMETWDGRPEAAVFWPMYWAAVLIKITIVRPLVAVFRLGAGRND